MLIGAMNNPKHDILDELKLFGEFSFDFVEITIEAPAAHPPKLEKKKAKIQELLRSYNFPVLAHLPWFLHLAHPYERVLEANIAEFRNAMESAHSLGAKKITIHPEFMPNLYGERDLALAQMSSSLCDLADFARSHSMELLLENFDAQALSPKDMARLLSEAKINMTFDVGHAHMLGGSMENFLSVHGIKGKISHVHLHDNFLKEDAQLPLGVGRINMKKVIGELKGFYDGTITLEVHSADRDYLQISRDKLEMLWYGKRKFTENRKYYFPQDAKFVPKDVE